MKMRPIALAVAGLTPALALASGVNVGTAVKASNEYLQLFGGAQGAAATVELQAGYQVDDTITFTYNVNPVASKGATTAYAWPVSLTIAPIASAGAAGDSTGTAGVLGKIDTGDNFVKYRVTTAPVINTDSTTVGSDGIHGRVELPGDIEFNMTTATGDVTVTPSSTLAGGGGSFDSYSGAAGDNTVVDTYGTQFKYAVTGLSNTIDVNTGRKRFIVGTNTASTFDFVVAASTSLGSPSLAAASGTIAVTLTGSDFSWLDSNTATNATGIQLANITFANGGTTVAAGVTSISFLVADTGDTITLGAGNGGTISEQSLSLAGTQLYSGNSKSATGSFTGTGSLTLNGSSVTVYAVPTSAAVSNFIWLTNTGTVSGDVELTVVDGGTSTDLGVIGVAAADSEFDVTKAMNEALAAQGVTLSGGRVHLEITTKVPASAARISAAYRVGDDRVNLLTSLETSN